MLEHVLGVSGGASTCLGAQVEENGVRLPFSKGMDGCFIDSRDKQGGGSTGMETVGFNADQRDVADLFGMVC